MTHLPLILKNIFPEDIDLIFRGLSDKRVTNFYGVHFSSRKETQEQMKWYANLEEKRTGKWWLLYLAGKKCIGAAGINDWNQEKKSAEIGFWIYPEYWHQGYANKTLQTIHEKLQSEYAISILNAYVEKENIACLQLIKKHGYLKDALYAEVEVKNDQKIIIEHYVKIL